MIGFMERRDFLKSVGGLALFNLFEEGFCDNLLDNEIEKNVSISGAGDVTLGYWFPEMFEKIKREFGEDEAFRFPFAKVKKYFGESDISIVNLEGALTNYSRAVPKKFNFKGDPKYARCLVEGSIDIVNLANNHLMDYYEKGALDTFNALDKQGVLYCGAGRNIDDAKELRVIRKEGVDVGFLGYAKVGRGYPAKGNSAGTNPFNRNSTFSEIKEAKDYCDVLVVSCHWGIERDSFPTREDVNDGRKMVDSGADVIFGHHPHVIQGIEEYNKGLVCYSLGNFVFGGNSFPADKDSMIVRAEMGKEGFRDYSVVPVITHPASRVFQPYVPEDSERILDKIEIRSRIR